MGNLLLCFEFLAPQVLIIPKRTLDLNRSFMNLMFYYFTNTDTITHSFTHLQTR